MASNRIESIDLSATGDDITSLLERDGCLIVRDAIEHAEIDRLLVEMEPFIKKKPKGATEFLGYETKRVHSLFSKAPAVGDFIIHDKVLETMDAALLPWCDNYRLSTSSITAIGPDQPPQMLHRGDSLYPLPHPTERNASCTAFWALTDYTESNGATRVVPGSHRWDDERVAQDSEAVSVIMPKGSFAVMVGAMWHGGGANQTTNEWRVALFAGYALGWLRQEQNMYLAVPPELARQMPEKLARIIGYNVHKPFLGWAADIQDPYDVITGYEELSTGGSNQFAEDTVGLVQSKAVGRA